MKQKYTITEKAGLWFNGEHLPCEVTIELSVSQAEYELMRGTIKLFEEPKEITLKLRPPKGEPEK